MRQPGKRCSIGDLAVLVRSQWPENRGRIVKITGVSTYSPFDWCVKSEGSSLRGLSFFGTVIDSPFLNVFDWQLQPIEPLVEPVEEYEEMTA